MSAFFVAVDFIQTQRHLWLSSVYVWMKLYKYCTGAPNKGSYMVPRTFTFTSIHIYPQYISRERPSTAIGDTCSCLWLYAVHMCCMLFGNSVFFTFFLLVFIYWGLALDFRCFLGHFTYRSLSPFSSCCFRCVTVVRHSHHNHFMPNNCILATS